MSVRLDLPCELTRATGVHQCGITISSGSVGNGEVDQEPGAGPDPGLW